MIKKQYIEPSIKAYKIHSASILEVSGVTYGGSNSGNDEIKSAESKSSNMWGWGDNEE